MARLPCALHPSLRQLQPLRSHHSTSSNAVARSCSRPGSSQKSRSPCLSSRSISRTPFGGNLRPASRRCTRVYDSVSDNLIQVLKDELKYQETSGLIDESMLQPPEPFELDWCPGKKGYTLSATFEKDLVVVEVSLDEQTNLADIMEEDNPMYEDEMEESMNFTVTVVRSDKAMTFECICEDEEVVINHMQFCDVNTNPLERDYTGPVFKDLDKTMQQAFADFLDARGINADLGAYLKGVSAVKAQQEYLLWLNNVVAFFQTSR